MAVDRARVAMVFAAGPAGERVGSGYAVGERLVLTAAHVLSEAGVAVGDRAEVYLLGSGSWVPGTVAWLDPVLDAALVARRRGGAVAGDGDVGAALGQAGRGRAGARRGDRVPVGAATPRRRSRHRACRRVRAPGRGSRNRKLAVERCCPRRRCPARTGGRRGRGCPVPVWWWARIWSGWSWSTPPGTAPTGWWWSRRPGCSPTPRSVRRWGSRSTRCRWGRGGGSNTRPGGR